MAHTPCVQHIFLSHPTSSNFLSRDPSWEIIFVLHNLTQFLYLICTSIPLCHKNNEIDLFFYLLYKIKLPPTKRITTSTWFLPCQILIIMYFNESLKLKNRCSLLFRYFPLLIGFLFCSYAPPPLFMFVELVAEWSSRNQWKNFEICLFQYSLSKLISLSCIGMILTISLP
jgi:hypothetical protein